MCGGGGGSHFEASSSCLAVQLDKERLWDWAKNRSSAMARTAEVKTPREDTEQTLSTRIMDWKIPHFSLKCQCVNCSYKCLFCYSIADWYNTTVTHPGFTWKPFTFIVLHTCGSVALSKEWIEKSLTHVVTHLFHEESKVDKRFSMSSDQWCPQGEASPPCYNCCPPNWRQQLGADIAVFKRLWRAHFTS